MKTLNVIKTNNYELEKHCGSNPGFNERELFIRCNRNAEVNWDKAPVYTWHEIQKETLKRRVCFLVPKVVKTQRYVKKR